MALSPPEWLYQWSQIVASLGTVVLTIFLVILYKRQQQQLAANHKPVLEVSDFEWEKDKVTMYISNFGNGPATNLSLLTLVHTDTGEHRKYSARRNHMKRQDKQGEWANTIQPGEEDVQFTGKSKIGELAPRTWHGDWIGVRFSGFIRKMKDKGVKEVKYLHLVRGEGLSNERCLTTFYTGTKSLNPQEFEHQHSLENIDTLIQTGYDDTFQPYFRKSTARNVRDRIYYNGIQFMNWILPIISIRYRILDASGTRLTKHVILRRRIGNYVNGVKEFILDILNKARDLLRW